MSQTLIDLLRAGWIDSVTAWASCGIENLAREVAALENTGTAIDRRQVQSADGVIRTEYRLMPEWAQVRDSRRKDAPGQQSFGGVA